MMVDVGGETWGQPQEGTMREIAGMSTRSSKSHQDEESGRRWGRLFPAKLQALLRTGGMRRFKVAELIHCNQSQITRWAQNDSPFRPKNTHVQELAKLFGSSLEDLISDDVSVDEMMARRKPTELVPLPGGSYEHLAHAEGAGAHYEAGTKDSHDAPHGYRAALSTEAPSELVSNSLYPEAPPQIGSASLYSWAPSQVSSNEPPTTGDILTVQIALLVRALGKEEAIRRLTYSPPRPGTGDAGTWIANQESLTDFIQTLDRILSDRGRER
jgi:hypothetical protein